jgi:hypothetical protein
VTITAACVLWYVRARVPALWPDGAYPALARVAADAEAWPAFRDTRPADDELMPAAPI